MNSKEFNKRIQVLREESIIEFKYQERLKIKSFKEFKNRCVHSLDLLYIKCVRGGLGARRNASL